MLFSDPSRFAREYTIAGSLGSGAVFASWWRRARDRMAVPLPAHGGDSCIGIYIPPTGFLREDAR
jgi:hypothetical protein